MNKISVIIPIYNEAERIGRLLKYLYAHSSSYNIEEIIVVDGGSTDASVSILQQFIKDSSYSIRLKDLDSSPTQLQLIFSEKSRPKQMNAGAKIASGSILYFLHADCYPPKYFDQYITDAVAKGRLAGSFKMKFDYNHWWLKIAGWFTQFNWKICRGGDQSLFVTTALFNEIGGYNEDYLIYEDNILIKELYKRKQFTVIQHWIITSARHYKKFGIWKLQYYFWCIHFKKKCGAHPNDLYAYYKSKLVER